MSMDNYENQKMFVSKVLVKSKAWLSLNTASSCQVYLLFLTKCVVKEGPTGWYVQNNGGIQFTYNEADEKWGISEGKFRRAIEMLVKTGFIDISKTSSGMNQDVNLYAISDRWQDYGTSSFVHKQRPKRIGNFGYKKGNKYGTNS